MCVCTDVLQLNVCSHKAYRHLLNQSKASVMTGGERLTESLNSCACLCAPVLPLKSSVHTAVQINHNYSICSTEMSASVKKTLCLFVCLSVGLFCLPFLHGNGEGKGGVGGE